MKKALLTAICAVAFGLCVSPNAQGAFDDPLFFYMPSGPLPPPPVGYLDGPCGIAVSGSGQIYVSDYYHRSIDIFAPSGDPQKPNPTFSDQPLGAFSGTANPHTGPLDDPCGLAFGPSGELYLNDYHREVVRFPAPFSLATAQVIDTGDPTDPYANPTGVALDPTTGHVFVDDRTYIAEYDSSGAFVRRIGEGSLQDGYGIAVSGHPGTLGYVYAPDAGSDTVKVFDPSLGTTDPKEEIAGPPGGFGSLRDSAVAIDDQTGEIYVSDTLGPQLSEEPQATIRVFASTGVLEGRLKHATIDAAPVGLAVDNSGGATQGHVYVTSGITEFAGFYGYPADAASSEARPPLGLGSAGGGGEAPEEGSPAFSAESSTSLASASAGVSTSSSLPLQATRTMRKLHRDGKRRSVRDRGHSRRVGRNRR